MVFQKCAFDCKKPATMCVCESVCVCVCVLTELKSEREREREREFIMLEHEKHIHRRPFPRIAKKSNNRQTAIIGNKIAHFVCHELLNDSIKK